MEAKDETLEQCVIDRNPQRSVNDVVMKIATQNGSGSQSSNLVLIKSILNMGIPVSGKNVFPSNIQGMPTWYVIRVNEEGWIGRKGQIEFAVAMNPASLDDDVAEVVPGGMLLLEESLLKRVDRDDITIFPVPFNKLVKEICDDTKLSKLVVNMMYVGIVAHILGIDIMHIVDAIEWRFSKKKKAAELNKSAAVYAYEWATEHLEKQDKYTLEPSNKVKDQILIEGNECVALGMLMGGATFCSWYPITPSTSTVEAFMDYTARYRHDPETGQATYAIVQAEDELGAMAMMVGASWAGARSFTATSGPGLSLMSELAGLAYFTETPAVIVDVQRMGPSTGMPTRTSQGDVAMAYQLSHGDCKHVLLFPGTMEECYEDSMRALNLSERLQTLVFVMSDLDLGMNKWMSTEFNYPEIPIDRGKVLTAEDLEKTQEFARYRDVDGDGIPYRTLPGTDHPLASYFTRGTGHTETAGYTENPKLWMQNIDRLTRKFETARSLLPEPIIEESEGAEIGILAFGSSEMACREACHLLREREEIPVNYLRMRALPAHPKVMEFIARHKEVYLVEQNRDEQMATILRTERPILAPRIKSVLHYDGTPIYAETIVAQVVEHLNEKECGI